MLTSSVQYPDLWHYLQAAQQDGKKIVLYGMGNGADKIWAVCDRYGITVHGVFASDGFVRGQLFHGVTVQTFSAVCQQHGADNLIVLLSFASSRPDVLDTIAHVASVCELYAPDVPVFGDTLFNAEFASDHRDELERARALLADDVSRQVFDDVLAYKLTGRLAPLSRSSESFSDKEIMVDILHADRFSVAADLGAYTGDTVRELLEWAPALSHAVAMEPDRRNFKKLDLYARGESRCTVHAVPLGAWSESAVLTFDSSGNRNANIQPAAPSDFIPTAKRAEAVQVDALDNVLASLGLQDQPVDYIKFDVEGSEAEAIAGCVRAIQAHRPALCISLYHRSEDLFALPLLLQDIAPDYRLYLRRKSGIPAWDLNLYAVP